MKVAITVEQVSQAVVVLLVHGLNVRGLDGLARRVRGNADGLAHDVHQRHLAREGGDAPTSSQNERDCKNSTHSTAADGVARKGRALAGSHSSSSCCCSSSSCSSSCTCRKLSTIATVKCVTMLSAHRCISDAHQESPASCRCTAAVRACRTGCAAAGLPPVPAQAPGQPAAQWQSCKQEDIRDGKAMPAEPFATMLNIVRRLTVLPAIRAA